MSRNGVTGVTLIKRSVVVRITGENRPFRTVGNRTENSATLVVDAGISEQLLAPIRAAWERDRFEPWQRTGRRFFLILPVWLSSFSCEASMLADTGRSAQASWQEN